VNEQVLQYVPLKEYKANLKEMTQIILSNIPNVKIMYITPPPIDENLLSEYNLKKGKQILIDRDNLRSFFPHPHPPPSILFSFSVLKHNICCILFLLSQGLVTMLSLV
jgi:hypothetical protein